MCKPRWSVCCHVYSLTPLYLNNHRIAVEIAKNAPIAVRAAKAALAQGLEAPTMEDALRIERQGYARTLGTKDRLEGLAAFSEGRSPNYKGQ